VDVDAPAISAILTNGVLTITGDNRDNALTVTSDAAGRISVFANGAAVPVACGVPTVTNTALIQMFGFNGNDVLLVDSVNGPMPSANLFGGEGEDTLTGGPNADTLDGGPGNDTLFGRDGNDSLLGGPGNDTLSGDRGVDGHFGGEGDDTLLWNPGDGSDVNEGGAGQDTMLFNGAGVGDTVDITANGTRLRFFRNPGNVTMDGNEIELIQFNARGGADTIPVNDLTGAGWTATTRRTPLVFRTTSPS
jgi:Ca2+-binding RTX toxin-like protein